MSAEASSRLRSPFWVGGSLVAVTLLVAPLVPSVPTATSAILAVATIAVCWVGLMRASSGAARPCGIVFWSFYGSWLGVAPLYQLSVNRVAWADDALLARLDRVHTAQWIILLGAVAVLAGSILARPSAPDAPVEPLDPRPNRTGPLLAMGGVALCLLPLSASVAGGLGNLFASRAEIGDAQAGNGVSVDQGGGPLLALVSTVPAALAIAVAYLGVSLLMRERATVPLPSRRVAAYGVAALGCCLIMLYSNPFSSTRFIAAAAIGCVLLAALRPRSATAGIVMSAMSVTVMLFAYPLAYAFRQNASITELSFNLDDWAGLDFDGFQQTVNTVQWVEQHGYFDGTHILAAVFYFVPRSLWATKPEPASITIAENRGYEFTNLSLPFSTELYLDLGFVGLILGMAALGWTWSRLDTAWLHRPGSLAGTVCPVVAMQQLGMIRGPMGSLSPVFLSVIAVTAFGAWVVRPRDDDPPPASEVPEAPTEVIPAVREPA